MSKVKQCSTLTFYYYIQCSQTLFESPACNKMYIDYAIVM